MYCKKCGQQNEDGAMFCENCGAPLESGNNFTPDPEPKKGKGLKICLITLVVLICLGGASYGGYLLYQSHEDKMAKIEEEREFLDKKSKENQQKIESLEKENEKLKKDSESTKEYKYNKNNVNDDNDDDDYDTSYDTDEEYKCNYDMNVRQSPAYSAKQVDYLKSGTVVTVYETQTSSNGSVWGRIGSSKWVCIRDNDKTYLRSI